MALNTINRIAQLSDSKLEIFTDTSGEVNIDRLMEGLAGSYRITADSFSNYNPKYNYPVTGNKMNKLFKFFRKLLEMERNITKN